LIYLIKIQCYKTIFSLQVKTNILEQGLYQTTRLMSAAINASGAINARSGDNNTRGAINTRKSGVRSCNYFLRRVSILEHRIAFRKELIFVMLP